MRDLWMMWEGVEENTVDELNFLAEQYPIENAQIGDGKAGKNHSDSQIRRSQIRWVKDELIKNKMYQYALHANRCLWNFDVNHVEVGVHGELLQCEPQKLSILRLNRVGAQLQRE